MQANYSIVETTVPADTRRRRCRLASDKRRNLMPAVRGSRLRQKNLSIQTRFERQPPPHVTRGTFARNYNRPREIVRVVTKCSLSLSSPFLSRFYKSPCELKLHVVSNRRLLLS